MKIEQNQENLKEAWMITTNALNIINQCFIKNTKNDKARDAYYELLTQVNRWYDEIKEMPF